MFLLSRLRFFTDVVMYNREYYILLNEISTKLKNFPLIDGKRLFPVYTESKKESILLSKFKSMGINSEKSKEYLLLSRKFNEKIINFLKLISIKYTLSSDGDIGYISIKTVLTHRTSKKFPGFTFINLDLIDSILCGKEKSLGVFLYVSPSKKMLEKYSLSPEKYRFVLSVDVNYLGEVSPDFNIHSPFSARLRENSYFGKISNSISTSSSISDFVCGMGVEKISIKGERRECYAPFLLNEIYNSYFDMMMEKLILDSGLECRENKFLY